MADITTVWRVDDGRGDWAMAGADLLSGDELATAVLISLFTDRRATADDLVPDETGDRRGWWPDNTAGSRLWLLERAKETRETLLRAKGYATEALQWLIDDGVAAKVEVFVEWTRRTMLGMEVVIHKTDGTKVPVKFQWAWKGLA